MVRQLVPAQPPALQLPPHPPLPSFQTLQPNPIQWQAFLASPFVIPILQTLWAEVALPPRPPKGGGAGILCGEKKYLSASGLLMGAP